MHYQYQRTASNTKKTGRAVALLLALLSSTAFANQARDASVAARIRAEDTLLLQAVHSGDVAAWEAVVTPDFAYVEEGEAQQRGDFLKGLLPADHGTVLEIESLSAHVTGDTAVVTHIDNVPDTANTPFGQAQYLMTETWQQIHGQWKLRLVHVDAIRKTPPGVALSLSQMDEFVGVYRHGGFVYTITRDGDHLMATRSDKSVVKLVAETRDILLTPGFNRSRKVFQRDAAGKVTGFASRSENVDMLYIRD